MPTEVAYLSRFVAASNTTNELRSGWTAPETAWRRERGSISRERLTSRTGVTAVWTLLIFRPIYYIVCMFPNNARTLLFGNA